MATTSTRRRPSIWAQLRVVGLRMFLGGAAVAIAIALAAQDSDWMVVCGVAAQISWLGIVLLGIGIGADRA